MSHRIKTGIRTLFCLALLCVLLKEPRLAAQGLQSGVQLCLSTVLPALFPFFVLCGLLPTLSCRRGPLRGTARLWGLQDSDAAVTIFLSWIGGYAVCARLVGQQFREGGLSSHDAALALMLGCCSGPGFVVGSVGGLLLGNPRLGILLYVLQIAANLLSAAVCLPLLPKQTARQNGKAWVPAKEKRLPQAIGDAVESSLQVCGCVLFFRIVSTVLLPYLPASPLVGACLSALLEISAGCADFASLGGKMALYGCCLCLSTLGFSVWAQLSLLLQGAVELRLLVLQRLVHLLLFTALTRLLTPLLPGITTVYSTLSQRVIPMHRLPLDAAILVFFFVGAVLYKVQQNFYNK